MLLRFVRWDLNMPTVAHFLEHWLSFLSHLFTECERPLINSCNLKSFRDEAIRLADLSLSDTCFIEFNPSLVAASCLAVTRARFSVCPVWPDTLEKLTGYCAQDLAHCTEMLICYARFQKPLRQNPFNSSVNVSSRDQVVASQKFVVQVPVSEQNIVVWRECRLKATPSNFNCARQRRHLVQSRDLKKMYCAV